MTIISSASQLGSPLLKFIISVYFPGFRISRFHNFEGFTILGVHSCHGQDHSRFSAIRNEISGTHDVLGLQFCVTSLEVHNFESIHN